MINRCRVTFPVRLMCRCLRVSASGYYAWRGRPLSERTRENQRLAQRVRQDHWESDGVFGSPRVWRELRYAGERCGKHRVARLMQGEGLQGIPKKKRWRKKANGQRPAGVRNYLDRNFVSEAAKNKWVTDITYIRTGEGWLYLCGVLYLYSDVVVGWSMSHRQDRQLVLQAVLMALWQRKKGRSVILHSDRGCQFTSEEYQQFLKDHDLICSMSAVGSCADNAAMKGFFGRLKRERVNRRQYMTRAQARADVFNYIECFYNPEKRKKLVIM